MDTVVFENMHIRILFLREGMEVDANQDIDFLEHKISFFHMDSVYVCREQFKSH
jgi:hypothetical protein